MLERKEGRDSIKYDNDGTTEQRNRERREEKEKDIKEERIHE